MAATTEQVQIGDRVRDRITGYEGIVTGRTEYLNGCRQFLVRKEGLKTDGSFPEGVWIDEQNLTVKDRQVLREPFPLARLAPTAGGSEGPERRRH